MTGSSKSGERLRHSVVQLSRWTVRLLVIGIGLVALFWVMGQLWSILLPVLLGLLLATILWPPVRLMRRKLPNALAAILALLGLIVVVTGLVVVLAPQVTSQASDLVDRATQGLSSLQDWAAGPPFNLGPDALGGLLDKGINELQANGQEVAAVV